MLELTEAQLQQMRHNEHAGFVGRVHEELMVKFPELVADEDLRQRLNTAHGRALALGLHSGQARTQFLYQEAFAPQFSEQPAVAAWLQRSGASPEQRWRDFLALATERLAPSEDRKY